LANYIGKHILEYRWPIEYRKLAKYQKNFFENIGRSLN